MKTYEGMFLFDPAVTSDWDSIQKELDRLFKRVGARLIASGKWDDRRLAYEINGRRRGIYALTYFEADPSKVVSLERDAQLSEAVLRCLVLRAEHLTEEQMKEAAESSCASSDDAKPDAAKPDAAKPDAAKPDAGKPDAGKPDSAKPKDDMRDDAGFDEGVPKMAADAGSPRKVENLVVDSNEAGADIVSAEEADAEEG